MTDAINQLNPAYHTGIQAMQTIEALKAGDVRGFVRHGIKTVVAGAESIGLALGIQGAGKNLFGSTRGTGAAAAGAPTSPKAEIIGRAQKTGTPGHVETANIIADELAAQPDVEKVFLNKSLKTVSGNETIPRRLPDVSARSTLGIIDVVEVPSKTDNLIGHKSAPSSYSDALINRGLKALLQLPPEQRGGLYIIRPGYGK